jgi:hypothetical protein
MFFWYVIFSFVERNVLSVAPGCKFSTFVCFMKIETAGFSETMVYINQTSRLHIPEDRNFYTA